MDEKSFAPVVSSLVQEERLQGLPQDRLARTRDGQRGGLRHDHQRAAARRQRAAEPRDLRQHLDASPRGAPDGSHGRQEHDRQGRVPADGRDREALREHDRPPLERARRRRRDGDLHDRLQRGGDARRPGAEVALAGTDAGGRQADRPPQPRDGRERAGLLGEVLPLLGRRTAPRADGGRSLPPRRRAGGRALRREHDRGGDGARLDLRRQLRAGGRDLRRAGRARIPRRPRRAGPRGRRLGRLHRPVRAARAGVGLPPQAGALDQRLRPQVRARVPGRRLGDLARTGLPAARPRLRSQLPRRAACRRSR